LLINMPQKKLSEMIRAEFVNPAVEARTRDSLLHEMVALAERAGLVLDPPELFASLRAREEVTTTATPEGLAMIHPIRYTPGRFKLSFLVLGRALHKIPFDLRGGLVADLFFLVCCQDSQEYSFMAVRLLQIIKRTDLLTRLRQAPDRQAMCECLIACEQAVFK
jgi:mannitol/fructose-specific phosphotransferase system IIA component (Ntr-type)